MNEIKVFTSDVLDPTANAVIVGYEMVVKHTC